jgi:hypothetical protein
MIVFNSIRNLVYINTEFLKRLPNVNYVRFLVSTEEKRLCLRPCGEDAKNAVRLRSLGKNRVGVRYIRCREFISKMAVFTQWNEGCRYKLHGSIVEIGDEIVVIFEITSMEEVK